MQGCKVCVNRQDLSLGLCLRKHLARLSGITLVHNTSMPIYSHEEFLGKYSQSEDRGDVPGGHSLGYRGASTGVERWVDSGVGI